MTQDTFRYVFGPVVSRRLGRSLGVDVVPFKTCSYNCIYCQLGPTTHQTLERKDYVPLEAIIEELRRKLDAGLQADHITISGSGEPTLYAGLKPLIREIKEMTSIPVAVITNGAMLWMPEVREAILEADVVVPSLDAGNAASFARVNRPSPGITFEQMVEGLIAFRKRYNGQFWLEIFLLNGITDSDSEVDQIRALVERIQPDKIQLNTVARPAPGSTVAPVPEETMEKIARRLGPKAEVIAHYEFQRHAVGQTSVCPEDVLAVIQRHPCNLPDIAEGLGISIEEAQKHIAALMENQAILEELHDGVPFYLVPSSKHDP
jgi:wyosine [tRNA(Phe)-imidazoG37] synthetase (radical SAM superfamily)